MKSLSDSDLLTAWEKARLRGRNADGPLFLLAAAYPNESFQSIAALSIGQRDRLLLEMRERLFGSRLNGLTDCTECNQVLEIHLDTSALKLPQSEAMADPLSVMLDEYKIVFRLPNSLDLAAIANVASIELGRRRLLQRLIVSALHQGQQVASEDLPEAIVALMELKMSEAEPQADIQLTLICSNCGARNQTLFDIGSLLWKEVDLLGLRLLREIHELAQAYGWSEAEILAMSSLRRRCYLEMLAA